MTRFTLAPLNDLSQYPLLLGLQTIGRFEFGDGRLATGAQPRALFQYPLQAIALHGPVLQLHTHGVQIRHVLRRIVRLRIGERSLQPVGLGFVFR